jgi:hypothetical protein
MSLHADYEEYYPRKYTTKKTKPVMSAKTKRQKKKKVFTMTMTMTNDK